VLGGVGGKGSHSAVDIKCFVVTSSLACRQHSYIGHFN